RQHSGMAALRHYGVHCGMAPARCEQRAEVLKDAFEQNPQRFVRGLPQPAPLPTAAWINKPKPILLADDAEPENSWIMTAEQRSGSHSCPITNDQPSVKGLG